MKNGMNVIVEAHRGNSAYAPENSLAAFRSAVEINAKWIELDIHPTLDKELIVIHDSSLERTTNGFGMVEDLLLTDILKFDAGSWFSPVFCDEKVPQLVDVINLVKNSETRLNIEIKTFNAEARVAEKLVGLLRDCGVATEFVISSFAIDALLQIKDIAPEIELAIIGDGQKILPLAIKHKLAWIHCLYSTINQELINHAHDEGIKVNAWTVDDPGIALQLAQYGIDKLCSNRPAEIMVALSG